jgi:hypothetical protein
LEFWTKKPVLNKETNEYEMKVEDTTDIFKDLDAGHKTSKTIGNNEDEGEDDGEVTRLYDFNSTENSNEMKK